MTRWLILFIICYGLMACCVAGIDTENQRAWIVGIGEYDASKPSIKCGMDMPNFGR